MVEEAREDGTLKQDESMLIRSVIDFDDLEAGDNLIPRVNIAAISIDTPFDEIMETFRSTGFSRLPVYKDTIDTICGILHEKDSFLPISITKKICIPSCTKSLIHRTRQDRRAAQTAASKKTHMAIVLDEYGGTRGIITLEDILEELVGEIWDEHDSEVNYFTKLTDDTSIIDIRISIVNAQADLSDFFNYYGIDIDEYKYDANTLSGWVIEQLGEIPHEGEKFRFENLSIEILRATVKKVLQVKVTVLPEDPENKDPKDRSSDRRNKNDQDEKPVITKEES